MSTLESRSTISVVFGFPTHDIRKDGPLPEAPDAQASTVAPEDRRLALSLAVELLKGRSGSAGEVTRHADELVGWLSQG